MKVYSKYPADEVVFLAAEQMLLPEFVVMLEKRDRVKQIHDAHSVLLEAEADYTAAWNALVAKINEDVKPA